VRFPRAYGGQFRTIAGVLEVTVPLDRPLDLGLTLRPLRQGRGDPSIRIAPNDVWRATATAAGAASVHLRTVGTALVATAWGPGAALALDAVPALVGEADDEAGLQPRHLVVAELVRRLRGLRMPRTGAVLQALVPTVLGQKVTAGEAARSYAALVLALGRPAPGPAGRAGLMVPPDAARLSGVPSYGFHRWGVERRRAETIVRACRVATHLEAVAVLPREEATTRLQAVAGVGPWTAAKVSQTALGDADAVCTGDFHLPNQVAWGLAGEARGDDARMLELLEPYRGHRARVQALLVAGGVQAPRFGPRHRTRSIAGI